MGLSRHRRELPQVVKRPRKRRGGITAEGRRRLSEAMKKRWARRRKKKNGDYAGPRMR